MATYTRFRALEHFDNFLSGRITLEEYRETDGTPETGPLKDAEFDELLAQSVPLTENFRARIQELTNGVEVNFDEPLDPENE